MIGSPCRYDKSLVRILNIHRYLEILKKSKSENKSISSFQAKHISGKCFQSFCYETKIYVFSR